MAINDDSDWLLNHIRHSFITSDDTGMCEMVIIHDLDVKPLKEIRSLLKQKRNEKASKIKYQIERPSSFKTDLKNTSKTAPVELAGSQLNVSPGPYSPSPDIPTGWDFGVRRRSNTAQKLERIKKERQNRVKITTVPWRKGVELTQDEMQKVFKKKPLIDVVNESPEDNITRNFTATQSQNLDEENTSTSGYVTHGFYISPSQPLLASQTNTQNNEQNITTKETNVERKWDGENGFYKDFKKTIPKNKEQFPPKSLLSKLLLETSDQFKNPFRDFARFNGKGQEGTAPLKKISIYVWADSTRKPKFSTVIDVIILTQDAKIQDLIGLTCWLYSSRNHEPSLKSSNVKDYSLHISEDDGDVDADFPALESQEPVEKFGFSTLTLVQKNRILEGELNSAAKASIFVKVNDHDGSSLIQVDDLNVLMSDILKKAIKKRKGNKYPDRYHLEYQNKHGSVVNLDDTLESTGVMEFFLVRQHSTRKEDQGSRNENGNGCATEVPPASPMHPQPSKDYPFIDYKRFTLFHVQKIRSTEVILGVSPSQIDIDPVVAKESKISLLLSPRLKPLCIHIYSLAHCEMVNLKATHPVPSVSVSSSLSSSGGGSSIGINSSATSFASQLMSNVSERCMLKLFYKLPESRTEYKRINLEGSLEIVMEAVDYIKQIMILNGNLELQETFKASKFSSDSSLQRRKSKKIGLFK